MRRQYRSTVVANRIIEWLGVVNSKIADWSSGS
jgi:hypothetical protein